MGVVSLGLRGHRPVGGDAESQGRRVPGGTLGLRFGGGWEDRPRGQEDSRSRGGPGTQPSLVLSTGHHVPSSGPLITSTYVRICRPGKQGPAPVTRESCIPEASESQSTGLSSAHTQAIGYKPARAFLKVHEPGEDSRAGTLYPRMVHE